MTAYTGQVQVDFVHDPTSASFTWVDITNRARAASYRRGRNYERAQVEAGGGTVRLRNDDGALDPTNGASAYSPNVIPFRRFQHNVTVTGPGTVPIFTGLVERWPQEWETGYGVSPVQVVDIFAWLSLAQLRSVVQQEIIADAPYVYLPLTDDATTTTPAMAVAPSGAIAYVKQSKNGGGSFAFAGGNGPAAEGTSALSLTYAGVADSGYMVLVTFPSPLTVRSGGVTTPLTLRVNHTTTANSSTIASVGSDNFHKVSLTTDSLGRPSALLYIDGVFWQASSTVAINDGKPHDLAAQLTSNGGTGWTLTLYVDGTSVASNTGTSTTDMVATQLQVGGFLDITGTVTFGSTGTYSHAAVLSGSQTIHVANHYNAGANGFAGETADARIARILSYVGWTAATALDACATTMLGATDLAGRDALSVIQEVQASEGGVFFASKAGVLTYKSRRTRMQTTTSSATFGESVAGGEVPALGVAFDYDPTYVYSDVQIDRTGSGHNASASSSTSKGHYGQRTLALTLNTQSDVEAQDAANWLLNVNLAPHMRVRAVSVDCLATSGAWAAVLPLEIGSRVTIKKRPANGTTITANSFVEAISWDIVDGKRAVCTLELSPIPLQALIADDATYGVCDSTFVAAW